MNDVKRKQTNNINYTARPSKLRLRRSLSNEGKNIFNNIVHQAPPLVQQQQYMYAIPFSPAPASNQVDNGQYYDNDESRRNSFVLSTPSTPIVAPLEYNNNNEVRRNSFVLATPSTPTVAPSTPILMIPSQGSFTLNGNQQQQVSHIQTNVGTPTFAVPVGPHVSMKQNNNTSMDNMNLNYQSQNTLNNLMKVVQKLERENLDMKQEILNMKNGNNSSINYNNSSDNGVEEMVVSRQTTEIMEDNEMDMSETSSLFSDYDDL